MSRAPVPIELQPLGTSGHQAPSAHYGGGNFPPPPRREVPGTLGKNYREAEERAKAQMNPVEGTMDNTSYYGLAAATWYALLSLPLLLFPRLVLFFAADEREPSSRASRFTRSMVSPIVPIPRPDTLTSLEVFMLRSLGFGLIALAAILVFVVVPAYKPVAPGRKAVVTVLAVLGCVTAVVGWNAPLGALSVIMGIGNGIVGCWGWWSIMFGEDDYRFGKYLKNDSRLKRL